MAKIHNAKIVDFQKINTKHYVSRIVYDIITNNIKSDYKVL